MPKSIDRTQTLAFTISAIAIAVTSSAAQAEVYKWRDARGVVQYSDKPPASDFTKASQSEIVNALQKKELCTTDPEKPATTKSKNSDKFGAAVSITSGIGTGTKATAPITTGIGSITGIGAVAAPKPATTTSGATTTASNTSATKQVTTTAITSSTKPARTTSTWTIFKPKTTIAGTGTISKPAPAPAPAPAPSTSPNIVQSGLMPAVDISKNMTPEVGYSTMRLEPDTPPSIGDGNGQFRLGCPVSHMSNDDPIVYPNQQGAAHHHTFFGNTSTNFKTNPATMSSMGNSTCMGGIANRSAYWIPSLIDTETNTPLKPAFSLWYYKTGYVVPKQYITAPPKGLRMIAGNSKSTTAQDYNTVSYHCTYPDGTAYGENYIVPCSKGGQLRMVVEYPQCWDGVNLDSPNHRDHMAYAGDTSTANRCPATHPIAIPRLSMAVTWDVTSNNGTSKLRLASDNYPVSGQNAGYSGHADWINGWDEPTMQSIVKNCLNAGKECGVANLGNGTGLY